MRAAQSPADRRRDTIGLAVTLVLAVAALAVPAPARAAPPGGSAPSDSSAPSGGPAAPPAGRITIDTVAVSGSGCRRDTVAVAVAPDATAFTVTFSDYLAQAGAGAKRAESRRHCDIVVRLNAPAGIGYAVAQADHRGFVHLEAGASATHTARYVPPGRSRARASQRTFTGPFSDFWQVTDQVRTRDLVYTGCRRAPRLTIQTSLRITADRRAPVSLIAVDSTDAALTSTYRLAWRRCR